MLSRRFKSCSKANVSGGGDAFACGQVIVGAGVEEECFFAATDEGTKVIIEVAGFLTDAGAPLTPALLELKPGPLAFFFEGHESGRDCCGPGRPGVRLRLLGESR